MEQMMEGILSNMKIVQFKVKMIYNTGAQYSYYRVVEKFGQIFQVWGEPI